VTLANVFASLCDNSEARERLGEIALRRHTRLTTFSLTTSSLRHLPRWFERLDEIHRGGSRAHGNFFADPASIGLVSTSGSAHLLTAAGEAVRALPRAVRQSPSAAEYNLLKILYFSEVEHSQEVQRFLAEKRAAMLRMLSEFERTPLRSLFLLHPQLLVIAELLTGFPGAVRRLVRLEESSLLGLISLGESGFSGLYRSDEPLPGLARLCRRVGSDCVRAEERRLHHIVSMALLRTRQQITGSGVHDFAVPSPFENLLTEADLRARQDAYTEDITIWAEGAFFRAARRDVQVGVGTAGEPLRPQSVSLLGGRSSRRQVATRPAGDTYRKRRHRAAQAQTSMVVDHRASERAEDLVEAAYLRPRFGDRLWRVGHTRGESQPLPDGMVPGADFYVLNDSDEPVEFFEVKAISSGPPADVFVSRAEYIRARTCNEEGIAYRLVLLNLADNAIYEVRDFAQQIGELDSSEFSHVVVSVGRQ